jgi:hypothetical protein
MDGPKGTMSVREFLASKQITVLEHPPYSTELAPSDIFLFPKVKEILRRRHFDDIDEIRSNTMATLKATPQNKFQNCFDLKATPQNKFQNCFEGWPRHWHRCIASQGEFFEGNHSDIQQ